MRQRPSFQFGDPLGWHCGRVAGQALLPGTAVLEVLAASAALASPDISSNGGLVIGAVFVAPLLLGGAATKTAQCSLDVAMGTVQLSKVAGVEDSAAAAQQFAHASIERPSQDVPLQQVPQRAAAGLTQLTPLAAPLLLADARMPRQQRQLLAQAEAGKLSDGSLLAVAPLDATLQLAAVGSESHRNPSQVFIPSGLQACRTPALDMCFASTVTGYWASSAADGGTGSHRLTAADDDAVGSTACIGMQFKLASLAAEAGSHIAPSAPLDYGASDVLYELSQAVESPATPATPKDAAAAGRCRLRLRNAQPVSAASAALAALQALGDASTPQGHPIVHIEPSVGFPHDVVPLMRTARLEQPALSAHLRGTLTAFSCVLYQILMCYAGPCVCCLDPQQTSYCH